MKKIIAVLAILALLCTALASCGGDDENTTETTESQWVPDWSDTNKTTIEADFDDLFGDPSDNE